MKQKAMPAGKKGFTLIELLVVITIVGVVLSIGLGSLASTLRSSTKTTIFNQVKQSGDLVLETMVRSIRSAADVCAGVSSGVPYVRIYRNRVAICPGSASDQVMEYTCDIVTTPSPGNGAIERTIFEGGTATTTDILRNENVRVAACSFSHAGVSPRRIVIDFTLTQGVNFTSPDAQINIPFHSEVSLRNF